LGVAGFKLRLHDIDDSRLSEIRARGGMDVEGEKGGFAPVERATTDLEPAIDGADVIIVVTGGNSQAVVALSLAPLLRDRQVILLIQGNTGGSLLVRRALDDAGCRAEIDVAEMDNYPYSCCRVIGVGEVIWVEDTIGKGHLSQHVEGKIRHSIFVPVE
jgi:opine dehydrogenase